LRSQVEFQVLGNDNVFAFGFWVGLVLLDFIWVSLGMLEIVDFFLFLWQLIRSDRVVIARKLILFCFFLTTIMVLGERVICIGPEILAAFEQTGTQISNTFELKFLSLLA